MLDVVLLATGLMALVFGSLTRNLRDLPLSEPLLALGVGVLLGPRVFDVLPVEPLTGSHEQLHTAARLLLAVSLTAIMLRYPLHAMRSRVTGVAILVAVAMPVMAAVTSALGAVVLGLGLGAALLLGTVLCPTDPVLASSVVIGDAAEKDVPAHNRQLLSLESATNDTLALPFVIAAVAVAGPLTAGDAAGRIAWELVGALVLGVALGAAAGWAVQRAEEHHEIGGTTAALFSVLLAFTVLAAGSLLHVNDLLAVVAAGLAYNVSGRDERVRNAALDEAVNRFAVLPIFLLLGAALPWELWASVGAPAVVFAVLVLVLRRLPILLLLAPVLRLRIADAAYLGWFGPIGVSAIFYLTFLATELTVPDPVLAGGTLAITLSTIAHGLSSAPGRWLFLAWTRGDADRDANEPAAEAAGDDFGREGAAG